MARLQPGQFIGKALTCLEEARGQATELDDMTEVYWDPKAGVPTLRRYVAQDSALGP